jgi:hypothetical protein
MKNYLFSLSVRIAEHPKAAKVLTAGLVWLLTWLSARFGFSNGPDWSAQIATAASIVAAWIVSEVRNYVTSRNVRTIQQMLPQPLKENGVANCATVAAVADVCQTAILATDGAYPPAPPARPVPGEH